MSDFACLKPGIKPVELADRRSEIVKNAVWKSFRAAALAIFKKWGELENLSGRESKIHFLKSALSAVTQVTGFTPCYSIVRTRHCSVRGILLFQFNLIDTLLHLSLPRHIRSPTPSFSATSKSNALLKTCPYHRTPVALASPFKVSFKPSKLISSCPFSQSS